MKIAALKERLTHIMAQHKVEQAKNDKQGQLE